MPEKPPIINCHTHIFTGDHVPPYLAKTFVPWPLHYLLSLSFVVKAFRFWYRHPYRWQFKPIYKKLQGLFYRLKMFIARSKVLKIASFLLGLFLIVHVFYIIYDWLVSTNRPGGTLNDYIVQFREWLSENNMLFIPGSFIGKLLIVFLLLISFKFGRNLIFFLLKKLWSFLGVLPGPQTKELAKRYLNIGRFSFYAHQKDVFERLKNQYPEKTGFVVLPMDMEYMGAGNLKRQHRYEYQMEALNEMKNRDSNKEIFFPFVFADPRRISQGNDHFKYHVTDGTVRLDDCFIKKYIEEYKFSGFKIYPALGYYPFDESLLPLWKYAADNQIPILTHCIRGTIYFRGAKKAEWDRHPVFEQAIDNGTYEPLLLPETKNSEFANNFTHPLNYLCLLDEILLRKLVGKASDPRVKEVFGYFDDKTPMKWNLSHLKLCFGHFGGDDEWTHFLESDRDNYASQLQRNPMRGITFLTDEDGNERRGKPEQIWKNVDWYSIICSIILQYPNVYGDLSYILHSNEIHPLLKQTLANPILNKRVLFGTDFYVVRNHKSEKNMLADMIDELSEEEFDQIARVNPREFLK